MAASTAAVRVRRAAAADLAAAAEVTVAAYAPFLDPGDAYAERLRDTAGRAAAAELWVAVDARDAVVGCVTTCPVGSTYREVARDDEGEFRMLAVSPDARRRGVGDALVGHVLAELTRQGFARVVLSSLPQMHDAHRLYARHGFTRRPERDWSPAPGIDLLVLDRTLTPQRTARPPRGPGARRTS